MIILFRVVSWSKDLSWASDYVYYCPTLIWQSICKKEGRRQHCSWTPSNERVLKFKVNQSSFGNLVLSGNWSITSLYKHYGLPNSDEPKVKAIHEAFLLSFSSFQSSAFHLCIKSDYATIVAWLNILQVRPGKIQILFNSTSNICSVIIFTHVIFKQIF